MDGSAAGNGSAGFALLFTLFAFFLPILFYFPPVPPSKRDALLETHSPVGLGPSSASGLPGKRTTRTRTGRGAAEDDAEGDAKGGGGPRIRSLWIYPLKSCRGIEVRQSKVLPTGLEFDRLYALAQLKESPSSPSPSAAGRGEKASETKGERRRSWHFITQRQFPLLATVEVDLFVPDAAKRRPRAGQQQQQQQPPSSDAPDAPDAPFLLVRFPWREPGLLGLVFGHLGAKLARGWRARPEKEFVLPVAFPSPAEAEARGYAYEDLTIWRDTVPALNMTADLAPELARYLGVAGPLGLFRVDPARPREVYRCAPSRQAAGYQPVTGFQDAYPLHLLNLASVRDLDAKVDKDEDFRELDPRRFRANIIVDGDESPYDEESWKKIRFKPGPESKRGASTFHVSCRTVRCKMPNVDQDTGYRHPVQPDKALRKFREVDAGAKHMGCLGMQLTPLFPRTDAPESMESWVEVGMSVEVLERGDHLYIPQ
ncbi:hypothetical protein MYCTH_2298973 [Thermothelomyces thermophilus ATCC 42464]|uniref:MOSC domain-containing protein n=1 Tax=Thermothelomyces thermophilus (strain ATCC 42464 / BCRC 31852 / DSM 1799) TaxID=573729 RepID=G2Q3Z0_THET4|nr:uncharacterized protein MYCTH_2298973 [Thermothelomyces thermophilus ATCC 42464]AEO55293.1 hypothetical protein MYCTH_2298973 [Thermothelomyces thermophilus ATCC 42464]